MVVISHFSIEKEKVIEFKVISPIENKLKTTKNGL
jgi:hypothetical protein